MLLNFSACLCDSLSLSVSVCASVCLLVCRNFHFVARVPHPGHLALSSLYLPRRCLSYFCVTLEFPCPLEPRLLSLSLSLSPSTSASSSPPPFFFVFLTRCPLLSSAAHFQSSMCAGSVIFLSTRSSHFHASPLRCLGCSDFPFFPFALFFACYFHK